MRPSSIAGTTVATTLLLVLSACSGDAPEESEGAAGSGSSPAATAEPSSSASPVEQELAPQPPRARNTPAAREAFARFVVETWGYALCTNDPRPVLRLSPGPKQLCAGCPELRRELAQRRKQGWYVDFPGAEVRRVRVAPGADPGTFVARARIDIPASTSYFDDGSFRNQNDAHDGATFELRMRRDGKRFELLGFTVR